MSMNLTENEIKAWWDEFEAELSKMVKPCVPMPPPILEKSSRFPRFVKGNAYYTLTYDKQFAVDNDHPNAVGWNYE